MKYRRKFEIIGDILQVVNNGAKKTRIMYSANLSHGILKKYLAETIKIGFIRLKGDIYEITEKGSIFLEKYEEFSRKYSQVKKELEKINFEMEVLKGMCTTLEHASYKIKVGGRKSN